MIEQLAEHGVTAEDLVPSLITTHVVDNPEYDPELAAESIGSSSKSTGGPDFRSAIAEKDRLRKQDDDSHRQAAIEKQWENERMSEAEETAEEMRKIHEKVRALELAEQSENPPISADSNELGEEDLSSVPTTVQRIIVASPYPTIPVVNDDDDEGDIGAPTPPPKSASAPATSSTLPAYTEEDPASTDPARESADDANLFTPLPSTLPGVSTTLTAADKTITLDIRWTILCDLFLSLIADSVYDARSRVLLGRIAAKLGLEWIDVVRFERRLTEALEIQEGVQQKEHSEILEDKRKQGKRQRYLMMGLATLGAFLGHSRRYYSG
jgi:hypothetical protein